MAGPMYDAYGNPYMGPSTTPEVESKGLMKTAPQGEVIQTKAPGKEIQIRNMKQVGTPMKEVFGERIYPKGISGPATDAAAEGAAKAGGKGLMSRLGGAAFGPVGTGVQAALWPGDIADGELSPAQREQLNPGMAEANAQGGQEYAQHIQDVAKQPLKNGQPGGLLMDPNAQPTVSRDEARVDPVAKAAVQEKERQQIEEIATKKLQTNQLSRTKAAEAVVQADCQRKGIDPAPEVKKKMVAEEVDSMRSLDTNELGKYLSFALMGLGFLAGGTSQANSDRFTGNFQSAYQNTINRAMKEKQMAAAAAQQRVENDQKEREIARKEKDTDSSIADREYDNKLADRRYGLDERKVGIDENYKGARLGQYAEGLDQGRARLGLDREKLGLYKERTAAQIKKDEAKAEKFDIPDMSQKDQTAAVKAELSDKGYNVSEGAAQQIAAEKRKLRENPAMRDATEDEISELAIENLQLQKGDEGWFSSKKDLKLKGE